MGRRNQTSSKFSVSDVLNAFAETNPKKSVFGNYRIEGDELSYRAQSSDEVRGWHDEKTFTEKKSEIAKKIREYDAKLIDAEGKTILLEGLTKNSPSHGMRIQYFEFETVARKSVDSATNETLFIGNSQTLKLVGRTVAYGHVRTNSDETEIQGEMKRRGFFMLPLDKFSDFDFSTFKAVEVGEHETHTVNVKDKNYPYEIRQRTKEFRPILFEIGERRYLRDVDRRELKNSHWAPFLTEVNNFCDSFDSAYQSMKPQSVLNAEGNGLNVKRFGKYFFIPVSAPVLPVLSIDEKLTVLGAKVRNIESQVLDVLLDTKPDENRAAEILKKIPSSRTFESGARTHIETGIELNGVEYLTGQVSRENRATLSLDSWHVSVEAKAVQNE